ncbi:hypothetical protein [Roseibium sp.]|uniref:hypothetical protein n=1 Tax=Roseibium sp. TaxID=1936156 RepID=UPI003A96EE5D
MAQAEFTIELGSDPSGGCPCCDPAACFPQGYVSRNGIPHAIYFADWQFGAEGFVELLVSTGEWGRDSGPEDRQAAAFRGRLTGPKAIWTPIEATDSLWCDVAMIGHLLSLRDTKQDADTRALVEFIESADHRIIPALKSVSEKSTQSLRPHRSAGGIFQAQALTKSGE